MTKGQQLRHQIARLSLLKAMPRTTEPEIGNQPFVRLYEPEIEMLNDVLSACARFLDDEGVPAQSWQPGLVITLPAEALCR